MQEIANKTFIETSYPGVTLGAIYWSHGLVLLDAPFRAEDSRSWRSSLLNMGGGVDRLLINLDAHFDRTLGARAMECTIIGHEHLAEIFRNRPVTFKSQAIETGAEWEQYNGLGSIRWAPPDITFTHRMVIHWDENPVVLEHHPGSAPGAIWVIMPVHKLVFVGDAVVINQPPFLASADLSDWLTSLQLLLQPEYAGFTVISGRGGIAVQRDILTTIDFLKKTQQHLESIGAQFTPTRMEDLVLELLSGIDFHSQRRLQYEQRLRHGLSHYFDRHARASKDEILD
jgi:glyoxylase-like metal-dependent hydrolase (beta-lactamase superfamily II)